MSLATLSRVVARVLRDEGLLGLLLRSLRFSNYVVGRFFRVQHVYVCRFDLTDLDSWPRPPVPCGIQTHFIALNSAADALAAQGYEDLRDRFLRARGSLEIGAVALCVYRKEKLAHVGWIACDSRAKWRFDDVPYPVDFERGEACLGSVFTLPEYRGQGLAPYSMRLRFEYLRGLGCLTTMAAVQTGNTASLRAMERAGPFTRRAALHVKLAGINYIRYDDSTTNVLMKNRRSEDVADTGDVKDYTFTDD